MLKRYVALLSQSGTDAPTAIVLENSLGGDVAWSRDSSGVYHGSTTGLLPYGRTWWTPERTGNGMSGFGIEITKPSDDDTMLIVTAAYDGGASFDGVLSNLPIEIRVYPEP